jgi:hypothetical protein
MTYVPGTWGEVVSEASANRDRQRSERAERGRARERERGDRRPCDRREGGQHR